MGLEREGTASPHSALGDLAAVERAAADAESIDADNRLLARYPLRRLDAEAIRDAMLAVSGDLDNRQGSPSVPTRRTDTGEVVPVAEASGELRRSVYLQQRRTQLASLLEVFDAPSIVATCTRRLPATIPLQSLSLMNSDFVVSRAARFAERLERECPGTGDAATHTRISRAFVLAVGRPPDLHEREAAAEFLGTQPARYPDRSAPEAAHRALADLCQMILASNAFLYVE
ncbi:MAG: DUF1553 domain-containing protein [Isosphaeraceae bacterium]